MDDNELAQIRKARLEQLKAQSAAGDGNGDNDIDGQKQKENEIRQSILSQILEPEAAERLGRVRMVKESLAQHVENRLILLARSGQLQGKITEGQIKELLGAVAETKDQDKIVITRKKGDWHDEMDDLSEYL